MSSIRLTGLLAATALVASPALTTSTATAAVKPGTVKYFNGGLHRPGGTGRPTLPRIVIRNTGNGWRASTVKATFVLDLYVEAGFLSDIHTVWGTVQGAPRYLKVLFSKPGGSKAKRVRITGGRFRAHANGLGGFSRTAETLCGTFGPSSAGTRTLVRKLNLDIRVSSYRNTAQVYRYYPKVDVAIVCERLPSRAPTAGNPHRDRPHFRITSAHLRFTKERKRLCPKQVSMQIRVYGTAPGKAQFRLIRSDGRLVQTGVIDVRRVGARYTGVYLKLDTLRQAQNFRYRVIIAGGRRVTSRWIRLRNRCGTGGRGFSN
jgi:hypothetical protein